MDKTISRVSLYEANLNVPTGKIVSVFVALSHEHTAQDIYHL